MIKVPRFISLEGIDGAGKSSHIPFIVDWLTKHGYDTICTREPGGTLLGEELRARLLSMDMHNDAELMLMFASRSQLLHEVILPALEKGSIVISDRFHDSSYAFQGGGRNISLSRIKKLDDWVGQTRPELTLYFDVPLDIATQRVGTRNDLDRFEREKEDFHNRVRSVYLARAQSEKARIKVIDSSQSLEQVRFQVQFILEEAFFGPKQTSLIG